MEDVGPGQIDLQHLAPALFTEIRKIALHNHSGQGTRKINLAYLTGAFTSAGFQMYASDGSKWKITVDTSGNLTTTQIT